MLIATLLSVSFAAKLKFNGGIKYETKWIDQRVDNFNYYMDKTYKMRYLVNTDFVKDEKTAPIFFYTGNEGPIDSFAANTGFMNEFAEEENAFIVYAEHRYYGQSLPYGNSSFTPENMAYLSVENALADFAQLIVELKKTYKGPLICFGGSYGGLLSMYMRMTYPNLVNGALAASSPVYWISAMGDSHGFWVKTTEDFSSALNKCEDTIRAGFAALDKMKNDKDWAGITKTMRTCQNITEDNYMHMLGWARNAMATMAMMDYPYPTNFEAALPGNPVKESCVRAVAETGADSIREAAGLVYNGTDPAKYKQCFDIMEEYVYCSDPTGCGTGPEALAWDYQCCTQQVLPGGTDGKTDMFPVIKFDVDDRATYCNKTWGVVPDRDWLRIKYWADNLEATSNTIFSNGDLDPWGPGGVTHDLRHDLPAPLVHGGAHHYDLRGSNSGDTQDVLNVRQFHRDTIRDWMAQFYAEQEL